MDVSKDMMARHEQGMGSLLLLDDDVVFANRLARTMETRGFKTIPVETMAEAAVSVERDVPQFAVVDIRLKDGSGLDIIEQIKKLNSDARIIVLTGYGNIATAVSAVKLGAFDYLEKPATADDIYYALTREDNEKPLPPENPMSADRVRWEHIQRVFEACDRNVSETARRLSMHRRTLQRILAKRAPR